jgi:hypothetical protein
MISDPDLQRLQDDLHQLEIREPFKSLLNPQLEIQRQGSGLSLLVQIDTYSAQTGIRLEKFGIPFPIVYHQARRFLQDPIKLYGYARYCIMQFVQHELDESLWSEGRMPFQPQHLYGPDRIHPDGTAAPE